MNTECQKYQDTLSEYLDGVLCDRERRELTQHLGRCERCREQLEALARTVRRVRELPVRRPPEGFAWTVTERLAARERPAPRRMVRLLWSRALPVAAMFLIAIGVTFLVRGTDLLAPADESRTIAMEQVRDREPAAPALPEREPAVRAPAELEPEAPAPRAEELAAFATRDTAPEPAPEAPPTPRVREVPQDDVALEQLMKPMQITPPLPLHMATPEVAPERRVAPPAAEVREPVQRMMFSQIPAQQPEARRPPHQLLEVTARRPTELLAKTVAAANRISVAALVEIAEDGTAEVHLNVPAEDYPALLSELAGLTEPTGQSLQNTLAAHATFFQEMLELHATFQKPTPPDQAEWRVVIGEPGGPAFEVRPEVVNLQVTIRPDSPRQRQDF